jgi:hypothetical protein
MVIALLQKKGGHPCNRELEYINSSFTTYYSVLIFFWGLLNQELDGQDTWYTLNKLNITAFWVMRLCTDRNEAMFRTNLLSTVPNQVTNSSVPYK